MGTPIRNENNVDGNRRIVPIMFFSISRAIKEEEVKFNLSSTSAPLSNARPKGKPLRHEGALYSATAFGVSEPTHPQECSQLIVTESLPSSSTGILPSSSIKTHSSSTFWLTFRIALSIFLEFPPVLRPRCLPRSLNAPARRLLSRGTRWFCSTWRSFPSSWSLKLNSTTSMCGTRFKV